MARFVLNDRHRVLRDPPGGWEAAARDLFQASGDFFVSKALHRAADLPNDSSQDQGDKFD
ncbi:hypothetical protein ACVIHI_003199 [Bradyrhizobium sp. USDA 4524]|uniref:hypothetical protein n=1 Tax=unclassified Bradyrhizobium TaxID=2631580 RepID=UPI00209FD8F4|nr:MULTISPECIES: hypothetical protein [unclassified Bradyrhizobium]MCP1843882.1 hypothetical protein [Bradyrhizobium sp. USDA 4538]MCP1904448.1 hypothetical protein [Bradyrhizobium sp. USDA 4537]MCP1989896.1 hypothetical protein [Bradyrhizobium sp. USDA 4539]